MKIPIAKIKVTGAESKITIAESKITIAESNHDISRLSSKENLISTAVVLTAAELSYSSGKRNISIMGSTLRTELRSCVKVEVAVLGSRP